MAQTVRLECTTDGHNKFYEMTENGDGTFTARYGAIGTTGATKVYPMSKWPDIYNSKIHKGYSQKFDRHEYLTQEDIEKFNSGKYKYGFTGESMVVRDGIQGQATVYRIVSNREFTTVDGDEIHIGDEGGWIERIQNLSFAKDDNSWVADDAVVCARACVCMNAVVRGHAKVYGYAQISTNAVVKGNASVCGRAQVCEGSVVYGDAFIYYEAMIAGESWVDAEIGGCVKVADNSWLEDCTYAGEEVIRCNNII